jgi:hypothetical protein
MTPPLQSDPESTFVNTRGGSGRFEITVYHRYETFYSRAEKSSNGFMVKIGGVGGSPGPGATPPPYRLCNSPHDRMSRQPFPGNSSGAGTAVPETQVFLIYVHKVPAYRILPLLPFKNPGYFLIDLRLNGSIVKREVSHGARQPGTQKICCSRICYRE